ncbi:uncharacterized protein LOC127790596 [Diospyros lotus]|uniref:uncharacterized protein LOC127790596 n=1 Tax=Diospyros lotus TaxID=55363 RepID=UPI002256CBA7|nr:uncharacterized protein LOC127790596 [Diospyros lotus]
MGNCQAVDNASLVIQHPCGRVEKLYWPLTAHQVMKMNPGHHVALLLTTTTAAANNNNNNRTTGATPVRITRIKLLRPTDTLVLGHAYRLVTNQDVMKGLWAKKCAKMKKKEPECMAQRMEQNLGSDFRAPPTRSVMEKTKKTTNKMLGNDEHQKKATKSSKAWQPSLQSISESAGS